MRHVINDYESLRHYWSEQLARAGEMRSLSLGERRILEHGSLIVLLSARLEVCDRNAHLGTLALRICAGLVVLATAAGLSGFAGPGADWALQLGSGAFLGSALLVLALAGVAHALLTRRVGRRRRFYLELADATVGLESAR